jgi:TPR repeat protein
VASAAPSASAPAVPGGAPAPTPAIADASGLEKKCDSGDGAACRTLGQGYATGAGVKQDELKAAISFEKACDKSVADACFRAADLRFAPSADLGDKSAKGALKNDGLAARDADKGCKAGNAAACGLYGRMELYGRSPNPDRKHAFELLDKVCSSNEPKDVIGPACNMLGYAYETGSGVAADIVKARGLYEKSCQLDHAPGCGRLGDLFVTGQGGEKNPKKAAELYKRACKAGVGESCDALKDLK